MRKTLMSFDISTNTGYAVADVSVTNGEYDLKLRELDTLNFPPMQPDIARAKKYCDAVCTLLDTYQPDVIAIEGYAMGAKGMSTKIIEVSALVKFALLVKGYTWLEVPPSNLKIFAHNKGNGSKSLMIKQVYKLWGIDTNDDNQADAVALLMCLVNLMGANNVPHAHTRAWDKLRSHTDYIKVLEKLVQT